MADTAIAPRSSLAGLCVAGRLGQPVGLPGVIVRERTDVAIAAVTARLGQAGALADKIRLEFGITLPDGPRRVGNGDLGLTWGGPGRWLATKDRGDGVGLERVLASAVGGLATVVDLGHALALLNISGSKVRETLAKGFAIDLHPRAFETGHTAMTVVAHIPVQITQISNEPAFEILVPRSLAGSFWHWLEAAAAEFGLEVPASG
ncbi:MAG: sarcosine oxidase subunit gamma [Rhizobiales bacterium]|nr:sarcosine oxidase subunit gamma [Hyphomicrobiales bacterium]